MNLKIIGGKLLRLFFILLLLRWALLLTLVPSISYRWLLVVWIGVAALYVGYKIFEKLLQKGRDLLTRRRESSRIRRHIRNKPRLTFHESEQDILTRLKISRKMARKIAWDYACWDSIPPFRRRHLPDYPGIVLEWQDRERLAQIYLS